MAARAPLTLGTVVWDWSRPYVLGVVNVTPDSFSDGGLYEDPARAVDHALRLLDEGADALDVGGESTRPGAPTVSVADELRRVLPVIDALVARGVTVPVSIDTRNPEVADAALSAGAVIVNDVGAGAPPETMGAVAAKHGAAYIAMHTRGTPETMRGLARYERVVDDVARELADTASRLVRAGVSASRLLLDPGIGFAKDAAHSLALLADLGPLRALGFPLCVGPSRKSFLVADAAHMDVWTRDASDPASRVGGTAAAVTCAVLQGAEVVRVHDVAVMRQAARVAHALRVAGGGADA